MKIFFIFLLCIFSFLQCENSAKSVENQPIKLQSNDRSLSSPIPIETPINEEKMDKQVLAKKFETIDPSVSAIILDDKSQIIKSASPFLKQGDIYMVSKFAPTHPIQIYIGVIEPDFAMLIGGDKNKYFEFIRKAELRDDNNELRIGYLLNFLKITNSGERLQILNFVDEIKQRPSLDESQQTQFNEFREKFRSIITAPKQTVDGSYDVFIIKGQDLVKLNLTISSDKSIKETETVLEKDLLIPYAL